MARLLPWHDRPVRGRPDPAARSDASAARSSGPPATCPEGRPEHSHDDVPTRGHARPPHPAATAGGFGELATLVSDAGLLREARRPYLLLFAANAVLLAGGVTAFVWLGPSWWQLLLAVFFAVVTTQLAFIGHDAGHRQIFAGRRANDVVGHLHGGLIGMSYGAWVTQHTAHHAHPNHADDDPDIDIPFLAFSPEQAATARGPVRWMISHQAYLFLPLLFLEGWSLHVTAVRGSSVVRSPARGWSRRCSSRTRSATWARCSGCSTRCRRSPSSSSTRGCGVYTWGWRSRRTTRACQSSRRACGWATCASRCRPRATFSAAGCSTSRWAA